VLKRRGFRAGAVQYRGLPLSTRGAKIRGHPAGRRQCVLDDPQPGANGAASGSRPQDRLDSWKKIASYLKRDVSTVQRWERREGMPVHRHQHDKLGSVFAYRSELDTWWQSRRLQLTQDQTAENGRSGQAVPVGAGSTDKAVRGVPRWVRPGLAAGVLLLAGVLAWLTIEGARPWRSPLADARFTRLGDFGGTEQSVGLSRDGKVVAFLASRGGQVDAWVGEVGSGSYRNLTQGAVAGLVNPAVRTPSFSLDSKFVALWTRQSDGSKPSDVILLSAPVGGGALQPYLRGAAEFDWSRDGTRLVYHTTAPGDPLFVRELAKDGTSTDRKIYVAPAGVHCHFPLWSPDDAFIYFVRGVPPDDWDVWRIRPSGTGLERITNHNTRVAYPVLLDQHTLLYLASDADGSGPWMYALDVERRVAHRISSGLESYTSLAASGDGARLVATVANPRSSLWRLSLTDSAGGARAQPTLLLADGAKPRLGPGFVLYVSSGSERQGIWKLAHETRRELWSGANARIVGAPAIAPDGSRIAFVAEEQGKTTLYLIGSDGSDLTVLAGSLVLKGSPAWAPDGRSVVVAAVRDGEPRLTRLFINGEAPLTLVAEYARDPVWSPNGRFLIYSGADVGTTFPVRAAAADGRPYPMPSLMLTRGARRVALLSDRGALVFLRGDLDHKDLWQLDLQNGSERVLAELPGDFVVRDFDISADGGEVVFDRLQENSSLALIERRP
jgi:Tol biopolymer transport system component